MTQKTVEEIRRLVKEFNQTTGRSVRIKSHENHPVNLGHAYAVVDMRTDDRGEPDTLVTLVTVTNHAGGVSRVPGMVGLSPERFKATLRHNLNNPGWVEDNRFNRLQK